MSTSTWNRQPGSGEWDDAANWTPAGVPTDTAVFSQSSQTMLSFSPTGNAAVERIEFAESASGYTFDFGTSTTPGLTISGAGVCNQSLAQQSFIIAATSPGHDNPQLLFTNSATAGADNVYYCAGPTDQQGYGGGVISFCDQSTAGAARFKVWTGAARPPEGSTVGGEVSFSDSSTAATASFTIYGSLGTDGDTFGNVVFHDNATAANATFTNVGGTVSGGDGGNTQFYGNTTAASGNFQNWGGTFAATSDSANGGANGGDVAFDATSTGGQGRFYNYAAPAQGSYGGVTSFNNNWPDVTPGGASAGNGFYFNYGCRDGEQGGGGHVEFSAKYGSPTAGHGCFNNYGSVISDKSSAGHTIFSISQPTSYFPTAGNGIFWNHPAPAEDGAAGFTEFAVYQSSDSDASQPPSAGNMPTAGNGTLINMGGYVAGAMGGYTTFSDTATAGSAQLIALGGTNGGYGGKIAFYDSATGDAASVQLFGNGELDVSDHQGGLTLGALELTGGTMSTQVGNATTTIALTGALTLKSAQAYFSFWKQDDGFAFNTAYTVLTAPNMGDFSTSQFWGSSIKDDSGNEVAPTFSIVGNALQVSFDKS